MNDNIAMKQLDEDTVFNSCKAIEAIIANFDLDNKQAILMTVFAVVTKECPFKSLLMIEMLLDGFKSSLLNTLKQKGFK